MKKTANNSDSFKKFAAKELPRHQQKNVFGGSETVVHHDAYKPLGAKIGQTSANASATL